MATAVLTVQKLARNKMSTGPDMLPAITASLFSTVYGAENSTSGPDFTVDYSDFDNLFIAVELSSIKAGFKVSSTGCTFGSEGIGDFTWKGTGVYESTDTPNHAVMLFGPFDASRFKDVSTGGDMLRLQFGTTGTSAGAAGAKIAAFAIAPNT